MHLSTGNFDAVIVDLDGTMIDTLSDFELALNLMLADFISFLKWLTVIPVETFYVSHLSLCRIFYTFSSIVNRVDLKT